MVAIIKALPPGDRLALMCQYYRVKCGQPLPGTPETETQAYEPGDTSATVSRVVRIIAHTIAKQRV